MKKMPLARKPAIKMSLARKNALLKTIENARQQYSVNLAGMSRMAVEGWPHSGTPALQRLARLEKKLKADRFTLQDMRKLREVLKGKRKR
ncbi:MAG: hypothetical protein QXK06_05270 [Candidatus Diapherotrites archaeon]